MRPNDVGLAIIPASRRRDTDADLSRCPSEASVSESQMTQLKRSNASNSVDPPMVDGGA